MKHTLTLHSVGLKVNIDEKKEFLDRVFGRGKECPENEYSLGSFDILGSAMTRLGDKLSQEDYGKVYNFLAAVEQAVGEGFSKVASDLLASSSNVMSEIDSVMLNSDGDGHAANELDCNVPSLYSTIIALLEGMKSCCHECLWNVKHAPRTKIDDAEIRKAEESIAQQIAGVKKKRTTGQQSKRPTKSVGAAKEKTPNKPKSAEKNATKASKK